MNPPLYFSPFNVVCPRPYSFIYAYILLAYLNSIYLVLFKCQNFKFELNFESQNFQFNFKRQNLKVEFNLRIEIYWLMFNGSGESNLEFSEVFGKVLMNGLWMIVNFWKRSNWRLKADLVLMTIKTATITKMMNKYDLDSMSIPMIQISKFYQNMISTFSFSKTIPTSAAMESQNLKSKTSSKLTSSLTSKLSTSSQIISNSTTLALQSLEISKLSKIMSCLASKMRISQSIMSKFANSSQDLTSTLTRKFTNSISCRYFSYLSRSLDGRLSHSIVRSSLVLDARYSYNFPLFFSTDYFKSFGLSQYNFKYRLFIFSFKLNSITASNVCDAKLLNLVVSVLNPVISFKYPMIVVLRSVISIPFFRFNYPISCCYCIDLQLLFLLNNDDVIRLLFYYNSVI